ncbi:Hypothetical protein PBC10988_25840 [Planctomycetales bacterium 10988]|nr:Hypothetical protein PBC10988_25840 [Planctomycetales bacterium 10988]
MPSLNSKNVVTVCNIVPRSGFSKKFWQDYRSRKCSGSGVVGTMEKLAKFGMDQGGSLAKVSDQDLAAVLSAYKGALRAAFVKAQGKAKSGVAAESAVLCQAYIDTIDDEAKRAQRRLDIMKQKAETEAKERRATAETLQDMGRQLIQLGKVCEKAEKEMKKCQVNLQKAFKSSAMQDGAKRNVMDGVFEDAEKSFEKLMKPTVKTINNIIKMEKNLKPPIDKNSPKEHQAIKKQYLTILDDVKTKRGKAQSSYAGTQSYYTKSIKNL